VLVLLVAVLAFLLASFPARNSDLWLHLARGRLLAGGDSSALADNPSWLCDLLGYGLYSALGGTGLVLAKALLVVALALVLLHLSRAGAGWWVPAFCTALALLAMSARLLLQPATVSYLLLALGLALVRDRGAAPSRRSSLLPPWSLLVLFAVWVNADGWFVLGLGTLALVALGSVLDDAVGGAPGGWARSFLRWGCWLALAAGACLLNPAHVFAFVLPPELASLGPPPWSAARTGAVTSPFQAAYFANLGWSPAALAYFPLLGLSLLSFFPTLPRWHWRRFLPWLGLAVLSAWQVRVVPFFAVVAGPTLAWNLQEFLARDREPGLLRRPAWRGAVLAGRALTAALVGGLVVCAWPGWLQAPPFEPRRWDVELAASLEQGAAATRDWLREGRLGDEPRGLHLSAEAANAFAWFCPEEQGVRDDRLAAAFRGEPGAPADRAARMRALGINHVIVYDTDRGRLFATMGRLLEEPQRWPLLYGKGSLMVFGWRDPSGAADPFRGWQVDLDRLAFHPTDDQRAPRRPADRGPAVRPAWEAFWKPARPRPLDQEEATLHLFHAEALRRLAPPRHLALWEASASAGLVAAAGGWAGPGALLDAHLRLTFLRPRVPEPGARFDTLPPPDGLVYVVQQSFTRQRDDTSAALLYLAVRAARRALAVNPDDAQAYLVLGESYLRLLHDTRERVWAEQVSELAQLRRVQASTALNQALTLKPDFAQAHLSLTRLYGEMGYLDLTLEHLTAYLKHVPGRPRERDAYEEQLGPLSREVRKREDRYTLASSGLPVLGRAFKALQLGLAGKARDLLLESNVAAFGERGMALELELLLRTGRAREVREWTGPEQKEVLGASYHWLRAQALAASGEYAQAQEEWGLLTRTLGAGPQGQEPEQAREVIALLAGQRVLDEQLGGRSVPDLLRRVFDRSEFRKRVAGLGQGLRREADLGVLRGLLLLEEGDADEAEIAFRQALTVWKDAAAAGSGAGLDFNSRGLAQGYLGLLQSAPVGAAEGPGPLPATPPENP
jgi:tetratricopeptide (TPR) repeat protein